MNPPWLLTMASDVERPRPVPLLTSLVVKNGSKMRSMIVGRNAGAGVGDLQHDVRARLRVDVRAGERRVERHVPGEDRQPPAARHGVARVHAEVEQHLVELDRIAGDGPQIVRPPPSTSRCSSGRCRSRCARRRAPRCRPGPARAAPRRRGRTTAPAGPCRRRGARSPRAWPGCRGAPDPARASLNMSTATRIGVSTLFRSCAMPPASVPMLSRRCARRNCCSRLRRSVMSVLMTSTAAARPASSLTSVQRLSTVSGLPSFPTCHSSPTQSPCSRTRRMASSNAAGSGCRSRATIPIASLGGPAVEPFGALVPVRDPMREVPDDDGVLGLVEQGRLLGQPAVDGVQVDHRLFELRDGAPLPLQRRDEQHGEEGHHRAHEAGADEVARPALRRLKEDVLLGDADRDDERIVAQRAVAVVAPDAVELAGPEDVRRSDARPARPAGARPAGSRRSSPAARRGARARCRRARRAR